MPESPLQVIVEIPHRLPVLRVYNTVRTLESLCQVEVSLRLASGCSQMDTPKEGKVPIESLEPQRRGHAQSGRNLLQRGGSWESEAMSRHQEVFVPVAVPIAEATPTAVAEAVVEPRAEPSAPPLTEVTSSEG